MTETTPARARLDAALDYAALDCAIFPLTGKIPFAGGHDCPSGHPHQHGHRDATTDPAIIRAWWTVHPTANIGLATGKASDVVVLDADGPEGLASVRRLYDGALPETPTVRTGKGRHFYFAHPGGRVFNAVRIVPGLDVRGDSGYTVVPPSRHVSGRFYEWLSPFGTRPLAPFPLEVRHLLAAPSESCRARSTPVADLEDASEIPMGSRNDTLYRLARSRLARGETLATMHAALRVENAFRCRPPLPEVEVWAIATHAVAAEHAAGFEPLNRMRDDEAAAYAKHRATRQATDVVSGGGR